eukprot:271450-Rhodomonas_salina.2
MITRPQFVEYVHSTWWGKTLCGKMTPPPAILWILVGRGWLRLGERLAQRHVDGLLPFSPAPAPRNNTKVRGWLHPPGQQRPIYAHARENFALVQPASRRRIDSESVQDEDRPQTCVEKVYSEQREGFEGGWDRHPLATNLSSHIWPPGHPSYPSDLTKRRRVRANQCEVARKRATTTADVRQLRR